VISRTEAPGKAVADLLRLDLGPMKIRRERENVFALTLTGQELSGLIAAARMAQETMEDDPNAPAEARALLRRLLGDYDAGRARLQNESGREAPAPETRRDAPA
jgi:hypothetical protein